MEKLFELTFQDQTLNPQTGTFTDASQTAGTFTLEDGEYYLTNGDTKGFYAYAPIAIQPDSETDNKVTVEFDLKVVTASVNTHTIIGTYAGVDGNGVPTGAKITLQYNAGDIELVLGGGATATLIESADVVVDQWYHFRFDCALAPTESTYEVKIDGVLVTTVTGATTDYELGIIGVLGTDLHACDECGIKNIRIITDDDYFVGRTALNQAFKDVKGYVDSEVGACIPRAGGTVFGGQDYKRTVDDSTLNLYGGNGYGNGAFLQLTGKNDSGSGEFNIQAHDGTNNKTLKGKADGTLTWGGEIFCRTVNDSFIVFGGGASNLDGASIQLIGKNHSSYPGRILLQPGNGTTFKYMYMYPDGSWTWNGTACQIISDQRLKQQISQIDDKLLDAWEDVEPSQFKYNDAVDQKGDKARLHTGYVVQQIDSACKSHNVDISDYGLYCHEEYPEETEEVEVEQKDGTKVKERKVIREANEHYSLRYTEVYAVECMYLRRCIARLTARIEELEKGKETEASK